jgi:hypothetical protein
MPFRHDIDSGLRMTAGRCGPIRLEPTHRRGGHAR